MVKKLNNFGFILFLFPYSISSMQLSLPILTAEQLITYAHHWTNAKREIEENPEALHEACKRGNFSLAKLLITAGACVNCKDNEFARTPLHHAANKGNLTIVQLLLEKKADPNLTDIYKYSPLHLAIIGIAPEGLVQTLLDHGACTFLGTKTGWTPLHWATAIKRFKIVKVLSESFFPIGCSMLKERSVKKRNPASLKKKVSVYIAKDISTIKSAKDILPAELWQYLLGSIINMQQLKEQSHLISEKKATHQEIIDAHCQRHLVYLQKLFSMRDKEKQTPCIVARTIGSQKIADFLEEINDMQRFEELPKKMQKSIRKNIVAQIS